MAIKKISANLLANNAVHTANIASGAISAADIADNSITAAKLSASTSPTFGGLTSTGDVSIGGADSNNAVLSLTADTGNWVFTNVRSSRNLEISDSDGTGTVFVIDTSGNVGIGRTPNANGILQLNVASGNYCNITFSENTTEKFLIGSVPGDDAFRIYDLANSAERMRIDSSGNVGVGTDAPEAQLDIYGQGTSTRGLQITATAASGYAEAQFVADSREWRIGSGGSTGIFPNMFYIYDQQGGSGRLLIDSATGDVRLVGGHQMTNALSWWNGGTGYELASIENASHPSYNDSGGLVFKTAKTSSGGMAEAMRIDSQGFVGMGTNNPLNKLHVQLPTGQNGDMLRLSRSNGSYSFQVGVDASSSYYVSNNSSTKIIDANYQGWVTHPQQPHIVFSPRNSTGSGYATHHHEDTTYSRSTLSTTTVGGYARVTVPTAGLYLVTFYSIGNNENSVRRDMAIAVNGGNVATALTEYNTNGFKYRCMTITLDLSANDYLTFSNDSWYDSSSAGVTTWRKVSITLIG